MIVLQWQHMLLGGGGCNFRRATAETDTLCATWWDTGSTPGVGKEALEWEGRVCAVRRGAS
jgi:hypothetical protein